MSLLEQILDQKRAELPELRRQRLPNPPPLRAPHLKRPPGEALRVIAEFKRRSPSAGVLSGALELEARVTRYANSGASMISVLCDRQFFGGGYEDLARAAATVEVPLLCKEFIIDEVQLDHARAFGASAALLIVRCLDNARLRKLIVAAETRGLLPVVEIVNVDEAKQALDAGASALGVNARDLDTLAMDAKRATAVLEAIPPSAVRAHFSGVKGPEQVRALVEAGVDAVLIGESLMRKDDPGPLLDELVAAAQVH